MRIISKKISLEPYKSRINGSLKCYEEESFDYVKPDYTKVKYKPKMYNYGMIPYNVIYNGKIFSYHTLMERYYFCKKYKKLIKYENAKCSDGEYKDVIEFYEKTFEYKSESLYEIYVKLNNTYNEYGGDEFLEWCEDNLYGGTNITYSDSANITIPLLFTNTIDNMGETSIFCDEWEPGINYKSEKNNGGAIVTYDDNIFKLKKDSKGYKYDELYKELLFEPSHWDILFSNDKVANGTTISGYTESKLSSLKTYGLAFDDMGNELPGCLKQDSEGKYIQPTEESYLDLPYKIGTTSNLTPIEDNKYFGNYISDMKLYYVDFYGNKVNDISEVSVNGDIETCVNTAKSNLNTFLSSHIDDNYIMDNYYSIQENVRCKIIYHIGAIINSDKKSISKSGVSYEEEVILFDKTFEYKLDEISSFIIHYYDIQYNEQYDTLKEYNNANIKVNKSFFKCEIEKETSDDVITAPVIREEYKYGSSSLENIKSDIYIDRGFSASFENHLKLLDVNSMESLENYGNGFYNIIES